MSDNKQDCNSPEETASLTDRFFFSWIKGLIKKARYKTLTEDDVWGINKRDQCCNLCPEFDKLWSTEGIPTESSISKEIYLQTGDTQEATTQTDRDIRQRRNKPPNQDSHDVTKSSHNILESGQIPSSQHDSVQHRWTERQIRQTSLLVVILKTFWKQLAMCLSLKLVCSIFIWLSSPFLVGLLLDSTADPDSSMWVTLTLTILLITMLITGRLIDEHANYIRQLCHSHMEAVLKNAIFKKALNLHTSSRSQYSIGQMTNIMSSDVGHISSRISNLAFLFYTPLHIIVIFCQLFFIIGPAAGLGLVVIVLLTPFNLYISQRINDLFVQNAKNKDERMKLLNEVLTGMKVLKLHAWEVCFGDMLRNVRLKEVKVLTLMTYYRTLHIFSWNTAPYMISVAMFIGYFHLNPDTVMTVKTAFAVISALNVLRLSINLSPDILNDINKIRISVKRVGRFLHQKEFVPITLGDTVASNDTSINITNASFTWDTTTTTPVLRNIDIDVRKSSLVAVVGQVGAGKSSLISAILGEIEKVKGHLNVQGSIAYVSQQAWIQNDTLQNNILFGKPMDKRVYKKVIQACALQPDIDILAAGDETEIGERGINLSGGQKQRVSLARAVYNDADIYLLDDPLSAVDSHVGKHIFDNIIKGILKEKVCVLVTHNLRYLPQVDNIVVLENGTVAETGSFRDLLNSDGAFTNVLKTYLADYEENRECLEDFETEEDAYIDVEMKTKLKRLESEDHSQVLKRQKSDEIQRGISRQSSRHLSTSDAENENVLTGKCIEKEKVVNDENQIVFRVFRRYIDAYGVKNMLLLLVFYILYYITFIMANMVLMWWTNDEVLLNITDSNIAHIERDIIWRTNMYYLAIYTFLGILLSLFIFLYAYVMSQGVLRASQQLHENMLNSILKSPMAFFDTTPVGRITNRFSHDMKVIDDMMPSCLEFWLDCVFNVGIGIAIVIFTSPEVLVLFIPLFYYYIHLRRNFIPARSQINRLKVQAMAPIESYFTESVTGADVIRAFRNQPRFIANMQSAIDHFNKIRIYGHVCYRWFGVGMLGIGYIIFGATTLLKSFTKGTASAAVLGFGIPFAMELNGNLRWLVLLQSDLETNLTSVERIENYINSPNEAEWRRNQSLLSTNWPDQGKLEFCSYSLRYRQGLDLVLRNISFTVTGGEKIGVVGRTGAGKSSLMLSLFRLVEPAGGAILIDGVDIADIGLHDLREKLAIIPQDPVLFTGTLRMNLDPRDVYKDNDIWMSLEHTHLRQFVESLPNKLLTNCGEGGSNFSVGQRQLFCLARTLLRKAKVLVLDEATAAVDMETDDLIQQTIRSEFKDCTVLTIAHRLNTVMDYDRILVLEEGHVLEYDTPNSLLRQPDGAFYSMAKSAGLV